MMFSGRVMMNLGVRCSSMARAFAHGAMGHRIDPSWWTHSAIFRSSRCTQNILFMVIWRQTYGKGPFR